MSERWRSTRFEQLHVVDVSPDDHIVRTKDGRTHKISLVTLRYRRDAGPDSEWSEPDVGLGVVLPVAEHNYVVLRDHLAHVPTWLLAIETSAQPMDP